MRQRKRCPYCRCLFVPDGRVAKRQWACTKPDCQQQRRRETQQRYRREHPEDATARRMRAAIAAAKAGEPVATPTGPPAPVGRFPWEELRDEIPPQAMVIASFCVRLVARLAQDEIRAQVVKIREETGRLPPRGGRDETAARAEAG